MTFLSAQVMRIVQSRIIYSIVYGLTYIPESAQQYVPVQTEVRVAVCLYSDCSPNSHSRAKVQLYYNVIIRIYLTSVPDPG